MGRVPQQNLSASRHCRDFKSPPAAAVVAGVLLGKRAPKTSPIPKPPPQVNPDCKPCQGWDGIPSQTSPFSEGPTFVWENESWDKAWSPSCCPGLFLLQVSFSFASPPESQLRCCSATSESSWERWHHCHTWDRQGWCCTGRYFQF